MEAIKRRIFYYEQENGSCPFIAWRDSLVDVRFLDALEKRLLRIRLGLLGQNKSVGEGVFEFKFDMGPGYRVYFAPWGRSIVVLLCGGDKRTQNRDIVLAKDYWKDFRRSNS